MVEAEASVSSCCPKISYQSFCQHELFEVVGDSHSIFPVMLAKSSTEEYLMSHLFSIKGIQTFRKTKQTKKKQNQANRKKQTNKQEILMRRRERMGHWREVRL